MTLYELFQPNSFGTIPTIDIIGVGTVQKYSENQALIRLSREGEILIDLHSTMCITYDELTSGTSYPVHIAHPSVDKYTCYVRYIRLATAEEDLIVLTINPDASLQAITESGELFHVDSSHKANKLHDGSGWVFNHYEGEPAMFYYEDILYRLDLQQKLT